MGRKERGEGVWCGCCWYRASLPWGVRLDVVLREGVQGRKRGRGWLDVVVLEGFPSPSGAVVLWKRG